MKVLFSALLLGSAMAFTASVASAQEPQTTTQNPFGQGAQPGKPGSEDGEEDARRTGTNLRPICKRGGGQGELPGR